jgi:hypothetical protein
MNLASDVCLDVGCQVSKREKTPKISLYSSVCVCCWKLGGGGGGRVYVMLCVTFFWVRMELISSVNRMVQWRVYINQPPIKTEEQRRSIVFPSVILFGGWSWIILRSKPFFEHIQKEINQINKMFIARFHISNVIIQHTSWPCLRQRNTIFMYVPITC